MSESIIKIPTLKNEKFGKVKVSIVGGLTAESDEITLEIKNCSPKRITYDGSFTLEMFKETWEKVNAGETYNECSYTLKGFSSVNETLKLGKALDCGKYRLTKEVSGKEYEIIFVISDFLEIKDILEWFNLSANRIKTKAVKVISNFSDLQYNKDFTETDFLSEMVDDLAEVIFMKDKRSVNYKGDDIIEHYPIFGEKYVSRAKEDDVSSALCTDDGKYYNITLTFRDCTDPIESGCANAFNLINSEDVCSPEGVSTKSSVKYYDATIECRIEKATGNMVWSRYTLPAIMSVVVNMPDTSEKEGFKIGVTVIDDYTIIY